jgi:site-specific DNA-cytosine methylase/2-polyprenyl-3-methyl-5-hydroxy-6-metoxy-1,4-benzoquinol methylase
MTALGAWIFAGGFTVGVSRVFDVVAHLEETKYGVATVRRNFPNLPVYVGKETWPIEALRNGPRLDFLYGNPPCAAWSPAGSKIVGTRNWRTDARVDCTREHFRLLETLRPRAWAWESVQQAFTVGRELVDELTIRALDLGYSVSYVLHNAKHLGVPQSRPRFFFVATDCAFDARIDDWTVESVASALRRVNDPGEAIDHNCRKYEREVAATAQGETLIRAWTRLHPEETWVRNERGQVRGRPVFTIKRATADQPAPVVMHELIHPTENRAMTSNELKTLCGFPPGYEFVGLSDVGQISRGVCPPVGEWLAHQVARSLDLNEREAPTIRLIDVQRPPGTTTILPSPTRYAASNENNGLLTDEDGVGSDRDPVLVSHVSQEPRIATALAALEATGKTVDLPQSSAVGSIPTTGSRSPKPGQGSGAFIRDLLLTGRYPTERILELVHEHFPASKAGKSDVAWNRGWLKKRGQAIPNVVGTGNEEQRVQSAPEATAAIDWDAVPRAEAWLTTTASELNGAEQAAPELNGAEQAAPELNGAEQAAPELNGAEQQRQDLRTGERQSNDPDRVFDRSSLRANSHGQWIHRDYAAHFFRWSWAGRFVTPETEVLDVGMGPDVAFVGVLTMPRSQVPHRYVGVDLNKAPHKVPSRQWAELKWEFNFLERYAELGQFDLVTNFEVIEHMYKPDGIRLLAGMAKCLKPNGKLLLSTPVFNGKAAANHLHEWQVPELQAEIEAQGLVVEARYGTFASQNELRRSADPAHLELVRRLSAFHSGEVLACFLAPLYPDASRNNVWVLRRGR